MSVKIMEPVKTYRLEFKSCQSCLEEHPDGDLVMRKDYDELYHQWEIAKRNQSHFSGAFI